ncbi:MAG TPA: PilZ domain-containing protein [Rhizomicrobium sp.]|jgi:hypothetical protein
MALALAAHNDATAAELRAVHRRRTFIAGRVAFRDGSQTFACTIRDVSDGGARLEFPGTILLPSRFFLVTSKHNHAFEAEVAWRHPTLLGVRFARLFPLDDQTDPQVRHLRDIARELAPRP